MKRGTNTPDYIISDGDNNFLVEEKVINTEDTERLLTYSKQLRLKSLHDKLDAIFSENPDSSLLDEITDYSRSIKNVERNNRLFLGYVNSLEDNEKFIVNRNQLLSLLLMDNKKDNAEEINKNFVFIIKCLCYEKSFVDLYYSLQDLDMNQLQFIRNYSADSNDFGPRFDKKKINFFVEFASHYKLNDYQKNKLYEAIIDGRDYSIDDILTIDEPEIVASLYDDINSRVEENKEEIISRYGEKFYEDNKSLFTNYVLSKNIGKIEEIIESKEFEEYPELVAATVLAKSNIDQIREILDIPYLKNNWYRKLISPSLFTIKPDRIITNIELCNKLGLEDFSNNRTLIIKNKEDELVSKINFLNYYEEPLFEEDKLHPLFSCDSNSDIKKVTKTICGKEISRETLKKYFSNDVYNHMVKQKQLVRTK